MPNATGRHYKRFAPTETPEGWRCGAPGCGKTFPSSSGAWGHVGKSHSITLKPFTHGTKAGYLTHRRRKQPACPGCKAAWRVYYQLQRAKKKGLI